MGCFCSVLNFPGPVVTASTLQDEVSEIGRVASDVPQRLVTFVERPC